jgi:hypothetical protein
VDSLLLSNSNPLLSQSQHLPDFSESSSPLAVTSGSDSASSLITSSGLWSMEMDAAMNMNMDMDIDVDSTTVVAPIGNNQELELGADPITPANGKSLNGHDIDMMTMMASMRMRMRMTPPPTRASELDLDLAEHSDAEALLRLEAFLSPESLSLIDPTLVSLPPTMGPGSLAWTPPPTANHSPVSASTPPPPPNNNNNKEEEAMTMPTFINALTSSCNDGEGQGQEDDNELTTPIARLASIVGMSMSRRGRRKESTTEKAYEYRYVRKWITVVGFFLVDGSNNDTTTM